MPSADGELVGRQFDYVVRPGDTLSSLARHYGVAATVLASDNHLQPNSVLHDREVVQIDNRHIVPQMLTDGIVINIPQRLLFVFDDNRLISCYPVALGRPGWPTPTGDFTIVAMQKNPAWIVPVSIQDEMADRGEEVVTRVPPGPHNPLGQYAILLNAGGYLIHGTDRPSSIYTFSSHGCIRLGAADIASLFHQVSVGEEVKIIYQPVGVALVPGSGIYLEVDPDVYHLVPDLPDKVRAVAQTANLANAMDWKRVQEAIAHTDGLARPVGATELASSHPNSSSKVTDALSIPADRTAS